MGMRELAITATVFMVMHGAGAAVAQQGKAIPEKAVETTPAPPADVVAPTAAPAFPSAAEPSVGEPPADPVAGAEPAAAAQLAPAPPVPAPPAPPPPAPPPPAPTAPANGAAQLATPSAPGPAAAPAATAEPHPVDPDPMSTFGIGPKLGIIVPFAFARTKRYRAVKYDVTPSAVSIDRSVPVTSDTQTSRGADALFSLAVPINLGDGHGIALDVEPTIGFCMSCDESRGDYTLLGVYGGLALRFQPATPFYMSIGAGLRPGITLHDGAKFSSQGELRIPITCTYYVHHAVGLVFEIAPGFGGYVDVLTDDAAEASAQADHAAGVAEGRSISIPVVGPVPYDQVTPESGSADAVEFGFGVSIDLSIGLRFP